jgi:hypothetical protein
MVAVSPLQGPPRKRRFTVAIPNANRNHATLAAELALEEKLTLGDTFSILSPEVSPMIHLVPASQMPFGDTGDTKQAFSKALGPSLIG